MAPVTGQKRKAEHNVSSTNTRDRKRQKGRDARSIPTQTADNALSTSGELNITAFVKAREFEITALDQSMKKSKKSLSQRAFQQVPRHMRRRTASHNVKKIPRRLRSRASREMKEDNTPTGTARKRKPSAKLRLRLETAKKLQSLNATRKRVRQRKKEAKQNAKEPDPNKHVSVIRAPRIKKNTLAVPPQATSKYKRRQVNKTWLPTHLWHTKRAHLTRPTLPLWRMAIPLKPTEKSYRPTHRAAGSRGCIAWDTSYVSTIGCFGTESALESMLKAVGFPGEGWAGTKHRKWISGTRFSEGWVSERDNQKRLIAPVTVVWQAKTRVRDGTTAMSDAVDVEMTSSTNVDTSQRRQKTKLDRRILIQLHPSAFHQFWLELLKVAKMQKPQVLVEDLRFEIGSIVAHGPASTEALIGVLKPLENQETSAKVWEELSSLNNPASLPRNAMLILEVLDPRYQQPSRKSATTKSDSDLQRLNEMIVSWPPDESYTSSRIFDHKERYRISKSLPSQKAISRRKSASLPGQELQKLEKDPSIPALLLAYKSPNLESNKQGSWKLLLPWSCVDLVWRSLMYCPLTSGNTPRFGGLEQTQQVAFENSVPWFPGDYPGLEAGKAWDRTESEKRFDMWLRRPTSKRFAWSTLDLGHGRKGELGRGWACDWEYLFRDTTPSNADQSVIQRVTHDKTSVLPSQSGLLTQRQRKIANAKIQMEKERHEARRNTSSPEPDDEPQKLHNDVKYMHIEPLQAVRMLSRSQHSPLPVDPILATVRIRILTKGTPKAAARIYRLPTRRDLVAIEAESDKAGGQLSDSGPPSSAKLAPLSSQRDCTGLPLAFSQTASSRKVSKIPLRQRWLCLDPNSSAANPGSSTILPSLQPKEHRNQADDPVSVRTYDPGHAKDLSHIRVFPPREAKPKVLNIFGPPPPKKTEEELLKTLQPQLVPKMIINPSGELVEEGLWDRHVPCPNPEDLIGFATTAGYSLSEGCGMAIGSIWLQRILEGWKQESNALKEAEQSSSPGNTQGRYGTQDGQASQEKSKSKVTKQETLKMQEKKQRQKQIERERHLCILRNAGESIGRLAIWELC